MASQFTFNGKTVTSPAAKAGVTAFVLLMPVVIFAVITGFVVSLWTHNLILLGSILALCLINRVLELKKKPFSLPSLDGILRFATFTVFAVGLWHHNWWMIVIGLLLSLRKYPKDK